MEIIAHRVNSISGLIGLKSNYGAEIDIRSIGNRLILQHEACTDGVDFEKWLSNYHHGTLILNIKEALPVNAANNYLLGRWLSHAGYFCK